MPEELSQEIYAVTAENYGHLGPKIISLIIKDGRLGVEEAYDTIKGILTGSDNAQGIGGSKLTILSLIGTGGYYLRRALGESEDLALSEAVADVGEVKRSLAKEGRTSFAEKAREYILGRVEEFRSDLASRHTKDDYDIDDDDRVFYDGDYLFILSTRFNQWLKDGGFTHRRVLGDWRERGWIKTEQRGGKEKWTILKRKRGGRNYYVVLTPKAFNDEER